MAKAVDLDEENSSLVKKLASTDKKIREKALTGVTKWLSSKASLKDDELKRIWKGLFYCMWQADKAPVQEELANNLAGIVQALPVPLAVQFFRFFLLTMRREWSGIDRLRLDKFYLLLRKFLRSVLDLLQAHSWEAGLVEQFMGTLTSDTLLASDKHAAVGVNLHLADIFIDELKICKGVPDATLLLQPWIATVTSSSDRVLCDRVEEAIFEKLIRTQAEIDSQEDSAIGACDLSALAARLFALASEYDTPDRNRKLLYQLYSELQKATKVSKPKVEEAEVKEEEDKEPVKHASKKQKKGKEVKAVVVEGLPEELKAVASPEGESTPAIVPNKSKKRLKKETLADKLRQTEGSQAGPAESAPLSAELAPPLDEEPVPGVDVKDIAANLSEKFAATSQDGKHKHKRKAGAVVEEADVLAEVSVGQGLVGKRVKKLRVVATAEGTANGSAQQGPLSSGKKKKVRFSLRHNIAFKPGGPVPLPALRTPPSARPRGPALKKTPSPRPHLERGATATRKLKILKGPGALPSPYVLSTPSPKAKAGKQTGKRKTRLQGFMR